VRLAGVLTRPLSVLADLLWPPACAACGGAIEAGDRAWLCAACEAEIALIDGPACRRCGLPLGPFTVDHEGRWCAECHRRPLVFKRTAAAGEYTGALAHAVKRYKFTPRAAAAGLAGPLARVLAERIRAEDDPVLAGEIDFIAPVPLHPRRRRERGFDQAEHLARALGRELSLPVEPRTLRRTVYTSQQVWKSKAARDDNVKDAFRVRGPGRIEGRTVLLVDDVMTTGATASACARALREAGARETRVAVVARTVRGRA